MKGHSIIGQYSIAKAHSIRSVVVRGLGVAVLLSFSLTGCSKMQTEQTEQSLCPTEQTEQAIGSTEQTGQAIGPTENMDSGILEASEGENGTETQKAENGEADEFQMISLVICQEGNCNNFPIENILETGIIKDITTLLWIAPRGGAGIEEPGASQKSLENPTLSESDALLLETVEPMEEAWYVSTKESSEIWIRLVCDAYVPGEGVNAFPSKDIMLYTAGEDAYLAVQDPQMTDCWTVTRLPEYGEWLRREADIFLRTHAI